MTDPRKTGEEQVEREARLSRSYSLADAIGREGAGLMKGASVVSQHQQNLLAVQAALDRLLADSDGALGQVMMRRLESRLEREASNRIEALEALLAFSRETLASRLRLRELVRDADAAWGHMHGERPFFNKEGEPPHEDDPYTTASVRAALEGLLRGKPS